MKISSSTLASIVIAGAAITGSAAAFAVNYATPPASGNEQSNTVQVQDPAQESIQDDSNQVIPPSLLPNPTGTPDPSNPPIVPPKPNFNTGDDGDDDGDDNGYEDSNDDSNDDDSNYNQGSTGSDDDDSEYEDEGDDD